MFDFFTAKFYERKLDANDEDAKRKTLNYVTILYFSVEFAFFLPISILIERLLIKFHYSVDRSWGIVLFALIFLVTPYYLKNKLIKKQKLEVITNKYKDQSVNGHILKLLIIFVPWICFFTGPTITVIMFGGTIFGNEYIGILTPWLNK